MDAYHIVPVSEWQRMQKALSEAQEALHNKSLALQAETQNGDALRAKLAQANSAYAELNVRLAGVEAERDAARVALANPTAMSVCELCPDRGALRGALTHAARAEARILELEQANASLIRGAHRIRCDAHATDATNAWGCPGCVAELRADRDRLQRVVDNLSHWHLCAEHQPDKWESDGTCPLCEGEHLKSVVDGMRDYLDYRKANSIEAQRALAKLSALLREGKNRSTFCSARRIAPCGPEGRYWAAKDSTNG